MSVKVANVALSDTFDTWRVRTNSGFTNLFAITGTKANAINANNVTGGLTTLNANVNITGSASGGGFIKFTSSANTQLNGSNTDITGDSLLITANTNVVGGTFLINGTAPGSDDTAIAFAIALG